MKYPWIANENHGTIEEDMLLEKLTETALALPKASYTETALALPKARYIAFYSNNTGIKAGVFRQKQLLPELKDLAHLLELRLFNHDCELKISRMMIGKVFHYRVADESSNEIDVPGKNRNSNTAPTALCYEEKQYLDISTSKPPKAVQAGDVTKFYSSTGGYYELPASRNVKQIIVVNYFKYHEETGNLQFHDFRIKGFE